MIKKLLEKQEVRFLFVGVLNTIVGYGIYAILVFFHMNYLLANTISTILGVLHSYLWNRFYTFKSKEKAGKEFAKFVSVYILSYLIGTCTLVLFKNIFHLNTYLAGLFNLVVTTVISFFGHKNFSFKEIKSLDSESPYPFEWIFVGILITFLFLSFLFGDVMLTSNASITFDKLLFEGHLYDFYAANYHTFTGMFAGTHITYDFPIYIFFGIWNLPLVFFTRFVSPHWETYYLNALYVKLFLVFLTFLSLVVLTKILKLFRLKNEDCKMYSFLFISSCLTLMVITMFCGYDILSVLFTLLGIYYYLKDDLKKFTLFFAIAISIKMFALLIFVPLLLLKEKKIPKILIYGIGAVSILLFAKLVYYHAPMYQLSMSSFESSMLEKFKLSYLVTPFNNTSIFVTLYALLCMWCYHKKMDNQKLQNLYTMYIPLGVFGVFSVFCQIHPQWIILLLPYLIFFIVYNKSSRKMNLLVETLFSVSMLFIFFVIYNGVFQPDLLKDMLFSFIFPKEITFHSVPFLSFFTPKSSLVNGVSLAALLYFMYMNKPERLIQMEKEPVEKWPHSILVLRLLAIIPFLALIIYGYFL